MLDIVELWPQSLHTRTYLPVHDGDRGSVRQAGAQERKSQIKTHIPTPNYATLGGLQTYVIHNFTALEDTRSKFEAAQRLLSVT